MVDRNRVGVVFGNIVLPTQTASALSREILGAVFEERSGVESSETGSFEPLNAFPAGLPAALVARALRLGGGAYTLDAACGSSLYALKLAVDELRSGRADAMLSGGVSRPDSLYTQMGFSQLRALSARGRPAPFDHRGDGLVVGEGAGMFVLKRLEDALKHRDRIYGAGRGHRPVQRHPRRPAGAQLRRSDPRDAHGVRTSRLEPWRRRSGRVPRAGTPVGDAVEVESLKSLWEGIDWRQHQCVIGSIKSNVGHTLTAAGAAGLLKVLTGPQASPSASNRQFRAGRPPPGLGE